MARRTLVARTHEDGAYEVSHRRGDAGPGSPIATALCFEAIFDHVAFSHHDLVVVENGPEKRYLPVAFAIPTDNSRGPTEGACIELRPEAGLSEAYLRGWIHATKGVLGDAIDEGWLTESVARAFFEERIETFAATTKVVLPCCD